MRATSVGRGRQGAGARAFAGRSRPRRARRGPASRSSSGRRDAPSRAPGPRGGTARTMRGLPAAAPAQHQTDTAADRAPENAERPEQGAESHQDQRRHGRRSRRRPEDRCQQRPQYDPGDDGIAPAEPRGERDEASHLVRHRSHRRGHFVGDEAVLSSLMVSVSHRHPGRCRVSACSWAAPRRAARGPRARLRAARARARR